MIGEEPWRAQLRALVGVPTTLPGFAPISGQGRFGMYGPPASLANGLGPSVDPVNDGGVTDTIAKLQALVNSGRVDHSGLLQALHGVQQGYQNVGQLADPYAAQRAQVLASLAGEDAGNRARQAAGYTAPDASQYQATPINLGVFPVRQMPAIPERPQLRPDAMSSLLGAVAGFIAPSAAGRFNAAPLNAARGAEQQIYGDRTRAFEQATQQSALQQQDAEAQRAEAFRVALANQANQQAQRDALRQAAAQYAGQTVPGAVQAGAGASMLGSIDSYLSPQAKLQAEAQANLQAAQTALPVMEQIGAQDLAQNQNAFSRLLDVGKLQSSENYRRDQADVAKQNAGTKLQQAMNQLERTQGLYDIAQQRIAQMGDRLTETNRHNLATEGIAQQRATTYGKRVDALLNGTDKLSADQSKDPVIKNALAAARQARSAFNDAQKLTYGDSSDVARSHMALMTAQRDAAEKAFNDAVAAWDAKHPVKTPVPAPTGTSSHLTGPNPAGKQNFKYDPSKGLIPNG